MSADARCSSCSWTELLLLRSLETDREGAYIGRYWSGKEKATREQVFVCFSQFGHQSGSSCFRFLKSPFSSPTFDFNFPHSPLLQPRLLSSTRATSESTYVLLGLLPPEPLAVKDTAECALSFALSTLYAIVRSPRFLFSSFRDPFSTHQITHWFSVLKTLAPSQLAEASLRSSQNSTVIFPPFNSQESRVSQASAEPSRSLVPSPFPPPPTKASAE